MRRLRALIFAAGLAGAAVGVADASTASALGPCYRYGVGSSWASGRCPVGQRFQLFVTFWKPGLTSLRLSHCENDGYAVQIAPYGGQVVTAISIREC